MLNWFQPKKETPAFWQTYEQYFEDTYSKQTQVDDLRFVVFDTETTGLDIKKNNLLSLGAVRVYQNRIDVADTLNCMIQQPKHAGGKEVEIHGILPKHSKNGMPEAEAIQRFLTFARNDILVGHHVAFDIGMLQEALKKIGGKRLKNKSIDTAQLAMRIDPPGSFVKPGAYSLDTLSQMYNLPLADRHTAAGDAFTTALLLLKLLARLRKRGIKTLGDLLRSKI